MTQMATLQESYHYTQEKLLLTLCLQAKLGSVLETFNLSLSFDPLISGPFLPVCFYFSPS